MGGEYLIYGYKDKSSNSYFVSFTEMKEISLAGLDMASLGAGLPITISVEVNTVPTSMNTSVKNNVDIKTTAFTDIQNTNQVSVEVSKKSFFAKVFEWIANLFH